VAAAVTAAETPRLASRRTTWIKKPPKAPIAPAIPITAAARRLKATRVSFTSSPFSVASMRPSAAKMHGIIR